MELRVGDEPAVIRQMADSGDPAATRVLFIAGYFESAASDVEALTDEFWTHRAA